MKARHRKKLLDHLNAGGSVISFARKHRFKRAAVHYQASLLGYAKFFLSPQEQQWLAKMPRELRMGLTKEMA